jgi:cold shock CspA family protein
MTRSGSSAGTVVRWDDDAGAALIELTDPPGEVWAHAPAVDGGPLRAGQVVTVDWTDGDTDGDGDGGRPLRAVRVRHRGDLQATPGG